MKFYKMIKQNKKMKNKKVNVLQDFQAFLEKNQILLKIMINKIRLNKKLMILVKLNLKMKNKNHYYFKKFNQILQIR